MTKRRPKPSRPAHLFRQEEPIFGPKVRAHFSAATFDIEEAGKRLALRRGTARVFHLMRAIEVGLKVPASVSALPSRYGTPNEIGRSYCVGCVKPPRWSKDDASFFDEVHASVDSMRRAWRNRPCTRTKIYRGGSRGRDVGVRGLMEKLASWVD